MGEYGIKISKEGYSVLTAGVPNLIMHSSHYGMKIVAQGIASFSVTNGVGGSVVVSHGLGYTPAFMAFLTSGAGKTFPPSSWDDDKNYEQFIASSDSSSLTFSVDANANSNYTASVYYYIFAEIGQ